MANTYTGLAAGGLTIQKYNNFRGVDFTDENVNESRSPDALNMWKDYKSLGKRIETRPDVELQLTMSNTIFGLFFYAINNVTHWIIHSGVNLYDYNPVSKELKIIKETGMNPSKSTAFTFNNIFFILDGINYLEYDGKTIKSVEGTIPTIAIHNMNKGETKFIQEANLLTDYCYEEYLTNGESTEFPLSQKEVSDVKVYSVKGLTETEITEGITIDKLNGVVTFDEAPEKNAASASIKIKYAKESDGANVIRKCKLACLFDNRVFFSGNQDYPNMLVWCGLNEPRYIGVTSYAPQGRGISQIKALVPGNNALWVFKEPDHENTTIFYNVPTEVYDNKLEDTVKTYASSHSSISTGCKATGINFNDDIVFFSDRGMEGISGDITTEQVLGHRSTLVDRKLLNEANYNDMVLAEWEGYLLVIIDNIVYLADSNQKVSNNDHFEYEWFYWELDHKIKVTSVHDNILYLCSDEGVIYTLTNNDKDREITSYWTTKSDDCNYPQMLKTTNKRGFKSDVSGDEITISVRTDNNDFETLGTYENVKGYIVAKLKRKKWNKIQLKFGSNKPFGIYGIAIETYIGSYVKR